MSEIEAHYGKMFSEIDPDLNKKIEKAINGMNKTQLMILSNELAKQVDDFEAIDEATRDRV